ncbi:hypothetical protein FW320_06700 [Azospirillum sp. Vi22]|uniref:hypothetical protein n=1 Tax=Azospirillum baldaniorum TaxID=1064539 RepID=UPI00157ABF50|nr:hypothetical protein [Azospirillum baldaniorum]NUB05865.1 hypothetical protein [Azospirillum baldaniorum]
MAAPHLIVVTEGMTETECLLEMRSAAVRAHDASPCRQTRAGLLEAERAYRAALGWTAEQIIAAQRVVNDRLTTFFGEPQK